MEVFTEPTKTVKTVSALSGKVLSSMSYKFWSAGIPLRFNVSHYFFFACFWSRIIVFV